MPDYFLKNKKCCLHSVLLSCIIACHAVSLKLLLPGYTLPIGFDVADHMNRTIMYYHWLQESTVIQGLLRVFRHVDVLYPPLFYVLSLFCVRLGTDTLTMSSFVWANFIFFIVVVFCVYAIANKLFDRDIALLSAFFFSSFPMVINSYRAYSIDMALTAMVVLGVYVLLWSDNFTRTRGALLFGLVSGLGLLTKLPYAIYIMGACIASCIVMVRQMKGYKKFLCVCNIALAGFVIGCIAYPCYGHALGNIIKAFRSHAVYAWPLLDAPPPILSIANWVIYPHQFVQNNTLVFAILCGIGTFLCIYKTPKQSNVLIGWAGFSIFFMSCMVTKRCDYLMPCVPAIAIMSMAGIMRCLRTVWRVIAVSMIVLYGVAQFIVQSYVPEVSTPATRFLLPHYQRAFNCETVLHCDSRIDCHELFQYLKAFYPQDTPIVFLTDTAAFAPRQFDLLYRLFRFPEWVINIHGYAAWHMANRDFFKMLPRADVFLFLSEDSEKSWPQDDDIVWHTNYFETMTISMTKSFLILHEQESQFAVVRSFIIGKGLAIHVWVRNKR